MNNKLLISESPLIVLPSLARALGVHKAIVLQQVQYWISKPSAHLEDGKKWVYNTYAQWHEQIPFVSVRTLGTLFRDLEKDGLLISKQLGEGNFNHTKYYTIDYSHPLFSDLAIMGGGVEETSRSNVQPASNPSLEHESTTKTTLKDDPEKYFNNRPEHLVNKGETKGKRMTKEELAAASLGIGEKNKLEGIPPAHQDLLRPFCEFYRYPFKDEVKSWIAQADVWLGRKYTSRDVVNACKYVVENEGWQVYQPASILKAFGKKLKKETIIREEPKKRY